ncbi:MAG: AAA family ATPase [Rivularia sp. ALOHA_DT_140]|nr:AAA family ATPase [Rivularia sp. ALOHA_DT_140]
MAIAQWRWCGYAAPSLILDAFALTDYITDLIITTDSKKVISASLDKTIKIWSLKNGENLLTIHDEYYANKITVTLNGKWILSELVGDYFPIFKLWDIYTGEEIFTLSRHDENTLKIHKSSNGNIIANFSIEDELESFTLAPDGVTIIAGDELGVVHFFRLEGLINPIENTSSIQQTSQEKTSNSIAREFVFTAIDNFLNRYDRGYFTIVGSPGSGKSTILARYITDNPETFYYSAIVSGKNRAEEFLKTITTQIDAVDGTSLQIILQQISDRLKYNQRFIIIIDSLDAIDYTSQAIGSNLFYLPRYLPKGIYFLLARRPFVKEKSGLLIEAPFQYFNLQDYPEENRQDIQIYIQHYLNEFESPSVIQERFGISQEEFIKQLTDSSENNFMSVSQILTAIKNGFYSENSSLTDIFNSKSLPTDLEAYYQQHLTNMFPVEQEEDFNNNAQAVLNILLNNSSPVSVEEISERIDVDEYDIEEILEDWIEFLNVNQIDGETCYNLYHQSFRNWLIGIHI